MNPTPIKTSNYSAKKNDLVRCDCTGGSFAVTLPMAPSNNSLVGVEIVANGTPGNVVQILAQGLAGFGDTITDGAMVGLQYISRGTPGTTTVLKYTSSNDVWTVQ